MDWSLPEPHQDSRLPIRTIAMVLGFRNKSDSPQGSAVEPFPSSDAPIDEAPSTSTSLLPVFACGAGLFSDGYVNNVIGSVSTILSRVSA